MAGADGFPHRHANTLREPPRPPTTPANLCVPPFSVALVRPSWASCPENLPRAVTPGGGPARLRSGLVHAPRLRGPMGTILGCGRPPEPSPNTGVSSNSKAGLPMLVGASRRMATEKIIPVISQTVTMLVPP